MYNMAMGVQKLNTLKIVTESGGKVGRVERLPNGKVIIHDALISGRRSKNNNEYREGCYKDASQYEGVNVYTGHADDPYKERPPIDKIARIRNAKIKNGLPYGDLHLNPKHPMAESIAWAAEHDPDFFGLSHYADCKHYYDTNTNRDVITEVVKVHSVDLVNEPATTSGLFSESKGRKKMSNKVKLSTFLEAALDVDTLSPKQHAGIRTLREAIDEMGPMNDVDPGIMGGPLDEDMDADKATESVSAALIEAMQAVIMEIKNGLTVKDALGQLKIIGKAYEDTKPAETEEQVIDDVEDVDVEEVDEAADDEMTYDEEPMGDDGGDLDPDYTEDSEPMEEEEEEEDEVIESYKPRKGKSRWQLEQENRRLKLVAEAATMGVKLNPVLTKAAINLDEKEQKEFLKQLKESKQSTIKSGFRSKSFKEAILKGPEQESQSGDYNRIIKGER